MSYPNLIFEPYLDQAAIWPRSGRHVLAQFDEETIIVYQAYCPAIGEYAIQHLAFGGDFSFDRMSWIKPNFLWMMYRSGWGTKPNQEVTLALRLRRSFFDAIVREAVPSTWNQENYSTKAEWAEAVGKSSVRLQWDPDHDPHGHRLERRAIQIGLRGKELEAFGRHELLEVIDLSDFVADQKIHVRSSTLHLLQTPRERVYSPA